MLLLCFAQIRLGFQIKDIFSFFCGDLKVFIPINYYK